MTHADAQRIIHLLHGIKEILGFICGILIGGNMRLRVEQVILGIEADWRAKLGL